MILRVTEKIKKYKKTREAAAFKKAFFPELIFFLKIHLMKYAKVVSQLYKIMTQLNLFYYLFTERV
jgi:hypothetical protein